MSTVNKDVPKLLTSDTGESNQNSQRPDHTATSLRTNAKMENEQSPKVLYTVFAGRKNRMMLQAPYWKEMIRLGAIHEVHLWNFTSRNSHEDVAYLQHLEKKYSFVTIMEPSTVPMEETYEHDMNTTFRCCALEHDSHGRATFDWPGRRIYSEYYKYYAVNKYDGVIIKADDDIVWINETMVKPFAEYIWNHRDIFLLSASVLNQGLCAHYQQKHGAIPKEYLDLPLPDNGMGALHNNATQALMLHRYFLESEENRRKFFITEPEFYSFDYTINVNFFALRGEDFPKAYDLIVQMLYEQKRYYDEGAITWEAIKKGYKEGIYMPLVVSHATFGVQVSVLRDVLTAYVEYGRKERAEFYDGILDDWVPPAKEMS